RTRRNEHEPGKKKQREFTQADVEQAITDLAQRRQVQQSPQKPGRRSAGSSGTDADTLPAQDPSFDTVQASDA
ncbi:ISNCY family transposase, partial [Paraburkholderia guartelaensis]